MKWRPREPAPGHLVLVTFSDSPPSRCYLDVLARTILVRPIVKDLGLAGLNSVNVAVGRLEPASASGSITAQTSRRSPVMSPCTAVYCEIQHLLWSPPPLLQLSLAVPLSQGGPLRLGPPLILPSGRGALCSSIGRITRKEKMLKFFCFPVNANVNASVHVYVPSTVYLCVSPAPPGGRNPGRVLGGIICR